MFGLSDKENGCNEKIMTVLSIPSKLRQFPTDFAVNNIAKIFLQNNRKNQQQLSQKYSCV